MSQGALVLAGAAGARQLGSVGPPPSSKWHAEQ
jgi:hypothetical protein